jgi:hypothetical protein
MQIFHVVNFNEFVDLKLKTLFRGWSIPYLVLVWDEVELCF